MGKIRIVVAGLVLGPLAMSLLVAPASAGNKQIADLEATLSPVGGETDGTGTADLDVFKKTRRGRKATYRACWSVTWSSLEQPVRGHVHAAINDAIVLPFFENVAAGSGMHTGCRKISKGLAIQLRDNPGYYVNLHDFDQPSGAIQGPLQPVP